MEDTQGQPLPLITVSEVKAARGCPRLHKYAYLDRVRAVADAEALRFGKVWHLACRAWRAEPNPELRLSAAMPYFEMLKDPFERARAEVLMYGYDLRWRDDGLEFAAVEASFRAPLVNPETGRKSQTYDLGGQIDFIAVSDGKAYLGETKTASSSSDLSLGSDYWKRLRLDAQVSIYYDGAVALGYPVAGCIYDVIVKPSQRQLKATPEEDRKYKKDGTLYANQREFDETVEEYRSRVFEVVAADPERFFARGIVVRLEEELDEARADVWATARMIRENELSSRHPRNPDYCVRYGRTCEYFGVCTGEQSIEDRTLFQVLDTAHPELEVAP